MRVLVAGATGTLGLALVPELQRAGHDVIGIARTPAGAGILRARGAEALVADVLDRGALLAAVAGIRADAVVHELTALKRAPLRVSAMRTTNALRTTGSHHLAEVAQAVGATRFVTQSIVFGYGYRRRWPAPVTESDPFGEPETRATDAVLAALVEAERAAQSIPGVTGTALRYGLFFGRDAPQIAPMLRRRMLPVARHDGLIPYVHHDDAAAATVAALERSSGGAYNVVGLHSSWRDAVRASAGAFGAPAPITAPTWLVRAAIPYAAELMTRMDLAVSSDRARHDLGWEPRITDVAAGWAAGWRPHPA